MFSLCSLWPGCIVSTRHSALSVRHIELADRKPGSWICLEFPLLSLHLSSIIHYRMSPSKTDDSDLSEGSRYYLKCWRWGDGHARRPRYLSNVKYLLRRNERDIAPLFVIRMIVLFGIARIHFLKKLINTTWHGLITVTASKNSMTLIISSWRFVKNFLTIIANYNNFFEKLLFYRFCFATLISLRSDMCR